MSVPGERPNTAVLVIDVQNDVVAESHERDAVVANIADLVERARSHGVEVIWIQHDDEDLPRDSHGWELVPELVPNDGEAVVYKQCRSAFDRTTLEEVLEVRQVGRLAITGSQTDFCVRWTLHAAQAFGYETVLVADGHTTDEVSPVGGPDGAALIAHTNWIWASQSGQTAAASVVPASDVSF